MLKACSMCPRKCRVNRLENETGFCRTGLEARVYSYMPHHGEEPPISGSRGSGTIFFSNCNMACAYCQNYRFSQLGEGSEASPEELAGIMIKLKGLGCHNINLVTPTHVMPQIVSAIELARSKGLDIPIVYNTGGYELPWVIRMLEGTVDVYLVDMRYADTAGAEKYSNAPDYPLYNMESVKEMSRQVGTAKMDKEGVIEKGIVIRHLVLPGGVSGTDRIMKFIAEEISQDTYISLMSQYHPYYNSSDFNEIARKITTDEYLDARRSMERHGLHNGWIQEAGGREALAGVNIDPKF